ncbi:RNA polymerase sigma factor [Corynebacterium sp.]|uniref:RNA polymerase sigma factor n=1 Tax=Corynebacterium sp. TaxID=1720 RepID=UPI0026DD0E68|nr:sigma-70 family RNA polymerase sigma factor [Corynebacterium sp.]MDO5077732.1 sigma-70 family RNA polymerase sigma factor [Corynebacterium sp.]
MSDAELLSRARAGDQRAFAELVTRYRHIAWSVCVRITQHQQDAEDALQIALASAWQNLSKFRGEAKFGTWFYRIASNSAMALVRKRKPVHSIDDATEDGYVIELEDFSAAFEDRLADQDRLTAALQQLTDESREALVLAEVAGLSYAEIAVHQQASLSAIKVRIHRAKKKLADML